MKKNTRTRVNISVDSELLGKAKKKLDLFGGKLSTLFNAYLRDFVESMDKEPYANSKEMQLKIKNHRIFLMPSMWSATSEPLLVKVRSFSLPCFSKLTRPAFCIC